MAEKRDLESVSIPIDSLSVENIDEAVSDWFDTTNITIVENRKVPVIFGSWERFAQIQGVGDDERINSIRDSHGKIKLPIITIKRSDIQPNTSRYIFADKNGDPSIVFHKEIAKSKFDNRRIPFTNKWKVNSRYVTNVPVYDVYSMPNPTFVNLTYSITFWSAYLYHSREFDNKIWHKYILPNLRYRGYFFYSHFDSSSDDGNTEDFSADERTLKQTFNLNVEAYLIDKTEIRVDRTPSKIVFEEKLMEDALSIDEAMIISKVNDNYQTNF